MTSRPFSPATLFRSLVGTILIWGLLAYAPATSFSQIKIEVDEDVKVLFLGQWRDGIVTAKAKRKQYSVDYIWTNDVRSGLFTRNNIRKLYEFEALDYGRNWESANGEFKIEAALKSWIDEDAILIKPDLTEITVPFGKLGTRDNSYIKKFIKNHDRAVARGTIPAKIPDLPDLELFDTGFSSTSNFSHESEAFVPLDPLPDYLKNFNQAGVGFNLVRQGQKLIAAIPVGGPEQFVLMSTREDQFFNRDLKFQSQLYWVSLKQKKVTASVAITSEDYAVDYDPRLKLLLSFNREKFARDDEPDHFTLWKLGVGESDAEPLLRFQAPVTRWSQNIFAKIIDERTVVIKSEKSTYQAWDLVDKKVIYTLKPESFFDAPVVLSPNRKNLIAPEDGRVIVVDAVTGDLKISARVEDRHVSAANVNSDGTKLAALTERNIYVWDLESGNKEPTIYPAPLIGSPFKSRIEWIGDDQILGESHMGRILYSLRLQLPIWSYKMEAMDSWKNKDPLMNRVVDGVLFYVAQPHMMRQTVAIGAVHLPGPGVEEIVKDIDRESLMILRPGVHVALDIGDVTSPEKVKNWLTKKIKDNGWILDEEAEIYIQAEMGIGPQQTVEYTEVGGGSRSKSLSFRPHFARLYVKRGKLIIWQTGTTTGPPSHISAGTTSIQSKLSIFRSPQVQFFKNVKIDPTVLDPKYSRGFGVSNLGLRGIEVVSTSPPGRADDPAEEARLADQEKTKALDDRRKNAGKPDANSGQDNSGNPNDGGNR